MKRLLLVFAAALAWAVPSLAQTVITVAEDYDAGITAHEDGAAAWGWTHDAFTLSVNQNAGTSAPVINTSAKDLRVYAKGSLTIEANGCAMTKVVFKISTQGLKRLAPITASEGVIAAQAAGDTEVTWTGDPTSKLTFTVGEKADFGSDGSGKAGQLDVDAIEITSQEGHVTTLPFQPQALEDGTYYIYNIETGQWLGNNITNRDRYHTSVDMNNVGLDWKITSVDGGWKLDSGFGHARNIDTNDGYLDHDGDNPNKPWTLEITDAEDNIFTISSWRMKLGVADNGMLVVENDNPATVAHFALCTPEDRLKMMKKGTAEAPQQATWLVPSFDLSAANERTSKWNLTQSQGSAGWGNNQNGQVREFWNLKEYTFSQTLTNLPMGLYRVRTHTAYNPTGNDGMNADRLNDYLADPEGYTHGLLFANGETVKLVNTYAEGQDARVDGLFNKEISGKYYADGWDQYARAFFHGQNAHKAEGHFLSDWVEVLVTDGTLKLGVKDDGAGFAGCWVIVGDFEVEYMGVPSDMLDQLKTTLTNAIAEASAIDPAKLSTLMQSLLADALEAAQTVDIETASFEELSEAIAALNEVLNPAKDMDVTVLAQYAEKMAELGYTSDAAAEALEGARTQQEVNAAKDAAVLGFKQNAASTSTMPTEFTKVTEAVLGEQDNERYFEENDLANGLYIYNVGTGRWFCGGDDWGAHAAVGFPGIKVTLPADNWNNGHYNGIITWLCNGNWGSSHKLNHGGYCDTGGNGWKFYNVDASKGIVTIARNGSDQGDQASNGFGTKELLGFSSNTLMRVDTDKQGAENENNQWIFVTEAQRDAMAEAAMATASLENPVDLTWKIKMPGFNQRERVEGSSQGEDKLYWECNHANYRYNAEDNGSRHIICERGSNHHDFCCDIYAWDEFSLTQTINDLKPGVYRVKVQGYYNNEKRLAYLEANGKKQPLMYQRDIEMMPWVNGGNYADNTWQAVECFQNGLYWNEVLCKVGEDGVLTIGVKKDEANGSDCFLFDNFRLEYVGESLGLPESMAIRSHGKWGGVEMKKADDSDDICAHFTASDYFVNDVQQEGIFINFKNGDDWYCPASGENVVVPAGEEVTEIVKLTEEKKGWVVQNQTGYMTVDVYCTAEGMKVVFNDNTVEALQDVEALYVVGEQTTGWSRSSDVCQKLEKVEDGIYEGTVEIKRDNMLFDAVRIITRPDNGDDDNHIGALNVGQQAIVGTRTLGTGSTGRMYLRKGENKITVNFNEGTITAEPINPEPSYMYAVGTLVDHVWKNTDTTYKLDEVEPNVFKGLVNVAEDSDSRFSLFCERTRDDWGDGRFGPIDESIKPEQGVATTNPISCGWDKAWRVPAGEWEVTLDLNNGSFLYDEYVPQADGILIDLATTTLDQWFSGIGNWNGESDSYATYDSKRGEVKVYINQDKDAQWKAQVKLCTTGIVLDPEKNYEFACNFESKNDLGGVTVKIFDNEQLFYNPSVALTAGANEFKSGAFAGGSTGNGVIVFDFGSAKAGDEITINGIKLYESEEPVVPDPQPETAPETPEIPEDALIIYADGKDINPAWGYCEGWGQSTNLTELDFDGNHVLYYKNFNYLGWGCASAVDASACNRLHIDFWAPEAGSIDLYPIFGGNGNATDDSKKATLNVEEGWNNIDIDLTTIEGLNLSSIFQFKFADGTMNVFAVDNVYFYNEAPFTIEVSADKDLISIVPSNDKDTWYYALMTADNVAMWQMYGISTNEDILKTMASIQEVESDDDLVTGPVVTTPEEIDMPDGDYVLVVAGAKVVDGELVLTTEPVRVDFTVGEPEPEPEPATFEIAVDGTQVTVTPSDEEATYAYVVINDAIMQELETTETGEIFDILANGFNEVQTGTQTFDILEDYLEFIGIDELTPGEDITVAVAQVKRAENKLILRTGDIFTKTFKAPETDGINGIAADAKETIFNLAGQRQLTRQRGVNIINGKKLLVK